MDEAHTGAQWARVRHVVVPAGAGRQGTRVLMRCLPAALLVPAVVLLLRTQGTAPSSMSMGLADTTAGASRTGAQTHGDLVQAVSSKTRLLENVAAHVKAAPASAAQSTPAAHADKLVAGRSSAYIQDAARAALNTHKLAAAAPADSSPASGAGDAASAPSAAPAVPAHANFAKKPSLKADTPQSQIDSLAAQFSATKLLTNSGEDKDKVLVKMFMEVSFSCELCRLRFSLLHLLLSRPF
jgi:hypothetical protein